MQKPSGLDLVERKTVLRTTLKPLAALRIANASK